MESTLGTKFVRKNNQDDIEVVDVQPFKQAKVVCLLFSGAWCPPCQGFVPLLIDFYNEINENEKQLEIIYVSRDRSKEEFEEALDEMPWLSLPYEDQRVQKLVDSNGIKGVPVLIILKNNGEVASKSGKMDVANEGIDAFEKWLKLVNT